jgi:hypothetical protein
MKKTYISPAIEILDGAVCQILLANSVIGIGESGSADKAEAPLFYDDEDEE